MLPFLFDPTSQEDWERALDDHAADLIGITFAIIVLHFGLRLFIGRVLRRVVRRAAVRRVGRGARMSNLEAVARRADTLIGILGWFVGFFMIFVWVVVTLDEFGHNVNALIAGLGVAGLAVGLAGQQLIRDFINGMIILFEDQYSLGDVVTIAGVSGVVEDINPRRTVLRDLDGNVHVVPNGAISVTTNLTSGFSRINLDVSIAYEEDTERVIEVINDECERFAQEHADVVLTAPSVLRINALGESGVDIKVVGDVRAGQQWALTGALRKRLKERFDLEGIEIPYPHRAMITKEAKPKAGPPEEPSKDAAAIASTEERDQA